MKPMGQRNTGWVRKVPDFVASRSLKGLVSSLMSA